MTNAMAHNVWPCQFLCDSFTISEGFIFQICFNEPQWFESFPDKEEETNSYKHKILLSCI